MIQLGLVSAVLPELPLEGVVAETAKAGYECVEVMCWPVGKAERRYAGVTHIDVAKLDDGEVSRIRDIFARENLFISGLGYYPNALSPDQAEAETRDPHPEGDRGRGETRSAVVNTFVGRDYTQSVDANFERFRKVWPELINIAEGNGIKVGIENCPMLFTNDEWPGGKNLAVESEDLAADVRRDPQQVFRPELRPVAPGLAGNGPDPGNPGVRSRFVHVHAKDARVDRERLNEVGILATPLEFHAPKLPGLGDVNWSAFFAELTAAGYRGPVCVEVEDRAYEGSLEDRLAAVRQSQVYLRQFCPGRASAALTGARA